MSTILLATQAVHAIDLNLDDSGKYKLTSISEKDER